MSKGDINTQEDVAILLSRGLSNDVEITDIEYLDFTENPASSPQQRRVQWNPEDGTLDIGMQNGVVQQVGLEQFYFVKNQTGSAITDGTPVMFVGSLGASGRLLIQPAIADGSIKPSYIMGIVTETIENGEDGLVTSFGAIRAIDTTGTPYGESWSSGDVLYVSATTPGYLTKVAPEAPNYQIEMAAVVYADTNVGTLQCRPTWNTKVMDSADIDGTPLNTDGQILVWNDTQQFFDPNYNITDYVPYTGGTTDLTLGHQIYSNGTYANIYVADGVTAQSIPSGTDYTKLTGFTNNGESSNCTADVANDKITFIKTGHYLVNFTISGESGTANITFNYAAFLNGNEQDMIHCQRKYATVGDDGNASASGIINVTSVGWDLDVRTRHDSGMGVDVIPHYMGLSVNYIGE